MAASVPRTTGGIFVGMGANLPSDIGGPRRTLREALRLLEAAGVDIVQVSPWYRSKPLLALDQPWFVNGVAELATTMEPEELLALLHGIEQSLGRMRRERWEARVADLDLIDYRGLRRSGAPPVLPHPGMTERLFVLLPLRDLAPYWRHPVTGQTVRDLIDALPRPAGEIRKLA